MGRKDIYAGSVINGGREEHLCGGAINERERTSVGEGLRTVESGWFAYS